MNSKLCVKDAARYLGTTRQTISRMLRKGLLEAETNPYDTRYKLISTDKLERVKEYLQGIKSQDEEDEEKEDGV
jgi:hypothetical protein